MPAGSFKRGIRKVSRIKIWRWNMKKLVILAITVICLIIAALM